MAHILREIARGFGLLVCPPICLLCEAACERPTSVSFCPSCREKIETDRHDTCRRCASTIGPHSENADGCPRCVREAFAFEQVFRLGPYEGLLRDSILRIKSLSGESVAAALGELWAERDRAKILAFDPQIVLPVPLHWRRRLWRGYNQSAVVAESLAGTLKLPFSKHYLRRIRPTPRQTSLTPAARRENLRGAFRATASNRVRGLRILLIDDVLTTGATAQEASRVLTEAGAAQVIVGVLAHR